MDRSPRASTPDVPLETEVLLAGFRDCTQEALSYLVHEEHLALDDPIVVGLQRHLAEKEEELWRAQNQQHWPHMPHHAGGLPHWACVSPQGYAQPMYWNNSSTCVPHMRGMVGLPSDYHCSQAKYAPYPGHAVSHMHHSVHFPCESNHSLDTSVDSGADGMSDMSDMSDTSLCDSEVEEILQDEGSSSSSSHYWEEELKQSASRLDGLAQNDDRIGGLLSELFGLMDEEQTDAGLLYSMHGATLPPMVPLV